MMVERNEKEMATGAEFDGQEKKYQDNLTNIIAPQICQTFLRAVRQYMNQGIHVFPVGENKIPLAEKWNDHFFEISDFESAKGIGSCPGLWPECVIVFDVDGPIGRKSWDILIDKYGPLPATYSVSTGRTDGGEHFYFKIPAGGLYIKSTSSKFAYKVDIRGTRGQAVLPPTVHKSGRQYQWKYDGMVADFVDISKIPILSDRWVQALIETDCAYHLKEKKKSQRERQSTSHSSAYGLKALEEETERVRAATKGQRNDTLNRAAFSLGQLVAGGELAQSLVDSVLEDAALATGLDEKEVSKTLRSGMERGMQEPRTSPGNNFTDCTDRKEAKNAKLSPVTITEPAKSGESDRKPEPLPDELLPVASFDFDLLPDTLRPWAKDICDRMQCPPDFVAVGIMAALAGIIGRKVGIRPQARTDWTVVCNMWALVVGRPGVLKSPALEQSLIPLKRLQAINAEQYQQDEALYQAELLAAKLKKESAEKRAREVLKKDPGADLSTVLTVPGVDSPTLKRLIANDTSPASLGELLRQNPNGLLIFRDEIVGLLKSLDREGQEDGRSFYLTAWNGDSAYTFDRIGRGLNLHIPAVCLSVLGGTQPGRLSEYIRHAVKGGAADDGLIQRFGLLIWPDTNGRWEDVDRWPDSDAKKQANRVFDYLHSLDPNIIGANQDVFGDGNPDGIPYLRFDSEGLALFQEWRAALEKRLRGELHPALESHFAKYRKLIPAIALICHLSDYGTGPVSEQATLRALAWGEYLETHAQRAYGSVSQPEISIAKAILRRIRKGDLASSFSIRDVLRPGWSKLTDREQVKEALRLLEDYNWLFKRREDTGGRPKTVFHAPKDLKK